MTTFNPDHPLHKASFYLEDLKWGRGAWDAPGVADPPVTVVGADEINGQLTALLRDAGLDLNEDELRQAADYYAQSWAARTDVSLLAARTLFYDGLTHGIALAAGLKGETPAVYR